MRTYVIRITEGELAAEHHRFGEEAVAVALSKTGGGKRPPCAKR